MSNKRLATQITVVLSPSKIRDFLTCPEMYTAVHMEKRVKPEVTPVMAVGNAMHGVLEAWHNPRRVEGSAFPLAQVLRSRWVSQHFPSEQESEREFEHAVKVLEYYLKAHGQPEAHILGVEKYLSSTIRTISNLRVKFNCKMDRIQVRPDDTLEIIDYKYSRSGAIPSVHRLQEDIPTFLYYLMARIHYSDFKNVVFTILNLQSLGSVSITYSLEQTQTNKRVLLDTIDRLIGGDSWPTPGSHCTWCRVQEFCPAYNVELDIDEVLP